VGWTGGLGGWVGRVGWAGESGGWVGRPRSGRGLCFGAYGDRPKGGSRPKPWEGSPRAGRTGAGRAGRPRSGRSLRFGAYGDRPKGRITPQTVRRHAPRRAIGREASRRGPNRAAAFGAQFALWGARGTAPKGGSRHKPSEGTPRAGRSGARRAGAGLTGRPRSGRNLRYEAHGDRPKGPTTPKPSESTPRAGRTGAGRTGRPRSGRDLRFGAHGDRPKGRITPQTVRKHATRWANGARAEPGVRVRGAICALGRTGTAPKDDPRPKPSESTPRAGRTGARRPGRPRGHRASELGRRRARGEPRGWGWGGQKVGPGGSERGASPAAAFGAGFVHWGGWGPPQCTDHAPNRETHHRDAPPRPAQHLNRRSPIRHPGGAPTRAPAASRKGAKRRRGSNRVRPACCSRAPPAPRAPSRPRALPLR
jgi:hypothetical protein